MQIRFGFRSLIILNRFACGLLKTGLRLNSSHNGGMSKSGVEMDLCD